MMTSRAIVFLSACFVLAGADTSVEQMMAAAIQPTEEASCNVTGIIKDFAYIIIDAADFGSAAWSNGVEVLSEVKGCLNGTDPGERVECVADVLLSTSGPMEAINTAVLELVNELVDLIEEIRRQIIKCNWKITI